MIDCRLLCSDVDGTLIAKDHQVSPLTREAIRWAVREKGIPFAIVSGRFRPGVRLLARELGIEAALCCFNGGYIEIGDKVLADNRMDPAYGRSIVQIAHEYGVSCTAFDLDDWYMDPDNPMYDIQYAMYKMDGHRVPLLELIDQWEESGHPFYKIIPKSTDTERIARLRPVMDRELGDKIAVFTSSPYLIETGRKGTDKANVIPVLCDHYHISPSQVMSFGDYENDLGMLRKSGYSVAMGNGTKEVREAAWYVTDSNLDDGIAKAIRKFIG